MKMKTILTIAYLNLLALVSFAQQTFQQDSLKAQLLISQKVETLKKAGVEKFMYLYNNAGDLSILYELDGKVKGEKVNYKANSKEKFQKIKTSNDIKTNFAKCISITSRDSTIEHSNCREDVHAFNKVVFLINAPAHRLKGNFTTDCVQSFKDNELSSLISLYKSTML